MRRHKGWLKWSLALVCLTFVVFYIPSFLDGGDPTIVSAGDRIATVGGRSISTNDFRRRYIAQVNAIRSTYGNSLSDAKLQQMQLPQEVLEQMIAESVETAEAERLGITVSDEEVRAQIMAIPALQENGHFIGEARYLQLLRAQNPPLTPADFERTIRQSLIFDKFRAGLTEWMSISDAELAILYRERNEKVTLQVVAILADNFQNQANPNDADIAAYYDAHKEQYRIPEQRKIRFVRLNKADIAAALTIPREEIERFYNQNLSTYTTPEEIRASHILLRTENKNEADVRAAAESVLKEAKAGADFAALARKYSEDSSNAQQGGDLDYFTRGRMVPEFEAAAFALANPGDVSDLVKTQFGFHIIKLTDRKAAISRGLDDPAIYQEIEAQVRQDQAASQVLEQATALAREGSTPEALERAVTARGLKMEESDFFPRGGLVPSLDLADPLSSLAFEMADNAVSDAFEAPFGEFVFYVSGKRDPLLPPLDDVRSAVRDDVMEARAMELAKKRADEVAAQLKSAPDFQRAARAAGLDAVPTQPLARESVIPNVGRSPEIDAVAFSLPVGGVSDAIVTPRGAAIVKVESKQDVSDADFAMARDQFRAEELNQRRMRFYQSYMKKARAKIKIDIDNDALRRAVG